MGQIRGHRRRGHLCLGAAHRPHQEGQRGLEADHRHNHLRRRFRQRRRRQGSHILHGGTGDTIT